MKSKQLIDAEIDALTESKQWVPPVNAFGDNNFDAIEAQKLVLMQRMGVSEIVDTFADEFMDDSSKYILDHAFAAWAWLSREGESPSEDWSVLRRAA